MSNFGLLILTAVLSTNDGAFLAQSNIMQEPKEIRSVDLNEKSEKGAKSGLMKKDRIQEEKLLNDYVARQNWIGRRLSVFFEKRLPIALRGKQVVVLREEHFVVNPSEGVDAGAVSKTKVDYSVDTIVVHTNKQGLILSVRMS